MACGISSGSLAKGCCQIRMKKYLAGGGVKAVGCRGGVAVGLRLKKSFEGKIAESKSILSMAVEKEPQKAGRAP